LAVVQRPGADLGAAGGSAGGVMMPEDLRQLPLQTLHMAPWNLSSTAIRDDVAHGRSVLDRVCAPVARYIADHGLYRAA